MSHETATILIGLGLVAQFGLLFLIERRAAQLNDMAAEVREMMERNKRIANSVFEAMELVEYGAWQEARDLLAEVTERERSP